MEEKRSKSLQRYYDNRIKINERQKKYYREKYYPQNRVKLLDYQRIHRQMEGMYPRDKLNYLMVVNHGIKKKDNVIIEKNILVSF